MSQLLQSFIKRLQDATISLSATSGLGPGVEEFADMLWLAQYLPHKSKQQPKFWLLLLTMNCLAAIPFLRESPRPEPEPESPPDPQSPTEPGTLIDRPERITESQRKSQVKPLLVPAAAALRHPRQLARALRPLARKIDSRTEQVIDEEATAIAIAEKSFVGIVQKPASERWLELELVIEQSRIGAIWSRTCKEFIELLKRLGAFRVIRVWTLETSITEDEQHQPLLSAGLRSSNNRAMRCGQPNELLDSTGRRLVMVLSDCISPLWREGLIHDWLARWAKNGPAVIVQWFPTRYWSRTGLRAGDEVWLSALNPGTASDRLIRHYVGINPEEFQDFLAQLAEPQENFKTTSVVIPVVTLEPDSLEDWARVVVGSGDNQVVGRRFELRAVGEQWVGPLQPPRPLPKSGEERVRVFYETASDIAQELAGLMSLGPVSPEITNLIQETLLPESGAVHVAEVFLTGLLKEKSSQNYRFVPGAKELIQKSMTKIDRELVHQTLSNYVSDRYGHTPREFQAFLVRHDDWSEEQWQAVQGFAELKKPLSLKEITLIEQHHSELSRQSSRYQSYKDLSDREQEGTDYRIDYHQGISDAVIIAPHGGKIEPGATQITKAIAGEDHGYYLLEGLKPGNNHDLSIPSEKFDEPRALKIVGQANRVIAIHGFFGNEAIVYLGGLDADLRQKIKENLEKEGFKTIESESNFQGANPNNICNRGQTGKGVQIGIPWGLRKQLFDSLKSEINDTTLFKCFVKAIRDALSLSTPGEADYYTEKLGSVVTLDMVAIPGGTFMMGSPEVEERDEEKPQHEVTVQPFYMGRYPITQAQYQQVMGKNPSQFKGDERPVERLSWNDAVGFCKRLSKQTGKEYRLPSEAEWEYACRAGTTTAYYFGDTIEELANYRGRETTVVGRYPPNAFGLCDMHGNVWEWCQDDWHGDYRDALNDGSAWVSGSDSRKVIRGGSWNNAPDDCRSASRGLFTRGLRSDLIGFRVVCVAPRTT